MRHLGNKSDQRPNIKAFTLIEVLIAITLITLIVAIVAGAMRLSYRMVQQGEKRLEETARLRATMRIVAAQLQSEIPQIVDAAGIRKASFRGDNKRLQAATNYSLWNSARGYINIEYRVEKDDRGKQNLYVKEQPLGAAKGEDVMLIDGCDDISFEYYDQKAGEDGKWSEEWTDEVHIPEKVRFHLARGTGNWAIVIPLKTRPAATSGRVVPAAAADAAAAAQPASAQYPAPGQTTAPAPDKAARPPSPSPNITSGDQTPAVPYLPTI